MPDSNSDGEYEAEDTPDSNSDGEYESEDTPDSKKKKGKYLLY